MNDLEIHRLIVENKKLQKALDKACEELTYLANQTEEVMFEDGITNTDKDFWKEWCLEDDR